MRLGVRDGEANSKRVAFALLGALCIHAPLFLLHLASVPAPPALRGDSRAPPEEIFIEVPGAELGEPDSNGRGSVSEGVEERSAGSSHAPRAAENGPATLTDDERGETGATAPDAPQHTPPGLTLEQLGVGSSTALLVEPAPASPPRKKDAAYYSEKLNRSLANSIAQKNQRDGAGPEGPIVTRLMRIAQGSNLPSDTSALLAVTADATGNVSSLEIVSTEGALQEWQHIASELRRQVQSIRLRILGSRGVRFTIRVSARDQLPSGADPGASVSVLGIPVSTAEGQRPHRAELLNPLSPGNIVNLSFDVADIGATARRVVHAHLESLEVLGAPSGAAANQP